MMQWYIELDHHSPKTPVILVGTKSDLRETQQCIPYHEVCQSDESYLRIDNAYYIVGSA